MGNAALAGRPRGAKRPLVTNGTQRFYEPL